MHEGSAGLRGPLGRLHSYVGGLAVLRRRAAIAFRRGRAPVDEGVGARGPVCRARSRRAHRFRSLTGVSSVVASCDQRSG